MSELLQKKQNDDLYLKTVEYYDHIAPYRARTDVEFYVEEAKNATGPVLELGCGTGRVLLPTAQAGCEITGLDASESMLERCREKLRNEPIHVQQRVELIDADMRAFDLGEKFGLITTPFRSFQHLLGVDDQLRALDSVRKHLRTDGKFILDLFNPSIPRLNDPIGEINMSEPEITLPDGRRVIRSHRFIEHDYDRQVNVIEMIHDITELNGTQSQDIFRFDIRYTFRFEAEHLLVRAGFVIEAIYSGYDRAPFGARYPGELILVARRR